MVDERAAWGLRGIEWITERLAKYIWPKPSKGNPNWYCKYVCNPKLKKDKKRGVEWFKKHNYPCCYWRNDPDAECPYGWWKK